MKELTSILFADKIIRIGSGVSVGLLFIMLAAIIFFYRSLPPILPLYNQMPWGTDRLGSKPEIFLPFSLALFFFITNLVFALSVYKKIPLVSRTLSITGLLLVFLALIFTIRTIQLIY